MENKNINIGSLNINLLKDKDFIASLKFETEFAGIVKGGHLPAYYSKDQQKRLVSKINLFSSLEKVEFVQSLFTSKN
ncbi:MAG: hypothetical protein HYX39_02485 [Bacteroidetes bacterium]|nr:hypothetical protein [Bacteroidota bacterium]